MMLTLIKYIFHRLVFLYRILDEEKKLIMNIENKKKRRILKNYLFPFFRDSVFCHMQLWQFSH